MNLLFEKRMCKMIAINYGLPEVVVWQVYMKLNSFDKVIKLAEDGTLSRING